MNKYNFERAGFEVNRQPRAGASHCACGDHSRSHANEIRGSYGETLNRRAAEASGRCGKSLESRYGLTDRPLASVYAPLQDFSCLYDLERALSRGTLFSALNLPLEVSSGGGRCRG